MGEREGGRVIVRRNDFDQPPLFEASRNAHDDSNGSYSCNGPSEKIVVMALMTLMAVMTIMTIMTIVVV